MTDQIERSLVIVKPDGYRRGLTGEVLRRIEAKGYALAALKLLTPTEEVLAAHFAAGVGSPAQIVAPEQDADRVLDAVAAHPGVARR